MANLVAMNMKRKDAEVGNHGFNIFLDPKRIKLQDGDNPQMMEEDKPAVASTAAVQAMASWVLPSHGQEAVHGTVDAASGSKSSEPPFSAGRSATAEAPMDVETDARHAPAAAASFWSGFF